MLPEVRQQLTPNIVEGHYQGLLQGEGRVTAEVVDGVHDLGRAPTAVVADEVDIINVHRYFSSSPGNTVFYIKTLIHTNGECVLFTFFFTCVIN